MASKKCKVRPKAPRGNAFDWVVRVLYGMYYDYGSVLLASRPLAGDAPSGQELVVWRRLAAIVVTRLADPVLFIEAQFLGRECRHHLPAVPSQLFFAQCFDRYEAWVSGPKRLKEVQIAIDGMMHRARTTMILGQTGYGWSGHEAAINVLATTEHGYTPLFHYGLARNMAVQYPQQAAKFLAYAKGYEQAAAIDYVRHKAVYDNTWMTEWLPADFREGAMDIYQHAFEDCDAME